MRIKFERTRRAEVCAELKTEGYSTLAWATLGLKGLAFNVEFPSGWHEEPKGWVHVGFGLGALHIAVPWSKLAPDEGQCSGPRYGFQFFEDILWLYYGQDTGKSVDRGRFGKTFYMPWAWRHLKTEVLSGKETYPYRYILRNGEMQERTATINAVCMTWWRPWLPFFRSRSYIHVEFNEEVGEGINSWKGGTIGCGYDMKRGETARQALCRMERERKFNR